MRCRAARSQRFVRAALAASIAAVALGLALVAYSVGFGGVPVRTMPATFSTVKGENRALVLADGSKVTLGADSEIQVRLERSERHVELNRGEAFFIVAKDPKRPFKVAVTRIGRDHLYVAFTYSWANADPQYDLEVIPFIQRVDGNTDSALHVPGSYYESNVYPFRGVRDAGAILVAGSDAPVNTPDPQPFVNMAFGVTRRLPGQSAESPDQAVGIRDLIDAYTINGARFLERGAEAGSIEVGKSADFIVVDQDILQLADSGRADEIAKTRVLATWFRGKQVYAQPGQSQGHTRAAQ